MSHDRVDGNEWKILLKKERICDLGSSFVGMSIFTYIIDYLSFEGFGICHSFFHFILTNFFAYAFSFLFTHFVKGVKHAEHVM